MFYVCLLSCNQVWRVENVCRSPICCFPGNVTSLHPVSGRSFLGGKRLSRKQRFFVATSRQTAGYENDIVAKASSNGKRATSVDAGNAASSGKKAALEACLSNIEKAMGKGTVMRLGDSPLEVKRTPTGSLTLDAALGGGLPKGRVVEIYGPESSGKTTLALHIIAEIQKAGGIAAFVDAEHALDPSYAAALGVDTPNLYLVQPDSGEAALETVDQFVRSAAVDVVVVDSVAALVPRAEIEGDCGDLQIGLQARLMSQALRKLTQSIGRTDTVVVFVNQMRHKIGTFFGNPETTSGGNALKYYASVRLDIRKVQSLKRGLEEYGVRTKVKVVKNKVAAPWRTAEFDIIFGTGIYQTGCIIDMAEQYGIFQRKGSWYNYKGANVANGRDAVAQYLADNPQVQSKLLEEIQVRMSRGQFPPTKMFGATPRASAGAVQGSSQPSMGQQEEDLDDLEEDVDEDDFEEAEEEAVVA